MRMFGLAAGSLGLALLAGAAGVAAPVRAEPARQAASPVATAVPAQPLPTAAPTVAPDQAPLQAPTVIPAGTPLAVVPAAAAETDVVTLVAWYINDPSGEFLNVVPLAVDPALVAGAAGGEAAIGRADFPEDGVPTVQVGDTRFDSYARSEGDTPERWTWFDDSEGSRPATLVLQVAGSGGVYQGYFGTATFVSRDDAAGGVLILALRPPGPAVADEPAAAAEEGVAEEAVSEDATDEDAAVDVAAADGEAAADAAEPDPDLEVPTETLTEPAG